MIDRYFACPECKLYIDPGHRWASSHLEAPGLVKRLESVDVDAVLGCRSYWEPADPASYEWVVQRVLPAVSRFLDEHREHGIVFLYDWDIPSDGPASETWREVLP
jgi:hypothetical protein